MSDTVTPVLCHCGKRFKELEALAQHIRDSPNHPQLLGSGSMEDQHMATCTRNAVPIVGTDKVKCPCGKTVKASGLEPHIQYSGCHIKLRAREADSGTNPPENSQQPGGSQSQNTTTQIPPSTQHPITPLDAFFASYALFNYDRSLPPATSWQMLQQHRGWQNGSQQLKQARRRYQTALEEEANALFGTEDDIVAWHTLCKAVGITDPPQTIGGSGGCKALIKKTHANIVDLVHWARTGGADGSVRVFASARDLASYSVSEHKIFPKKEAKRKENGKKLVIRYLLRYVL